MVTWDMTVTEWMGILLKLGFCKDMGNEALMITQQFSDAVKVIKKVDEPTLGDCFDIFKESNMDLDYIIYWLACNIGHEMEFDVGVREAHLKAVKNPKTALKIYYKSPFLTDKEDEILKEKFIVDGKHLFPQIEQELKDGTIIRAKNWSNTFGLNDLSTLGSYLRETSASARLEDFEIDI